MGLQANPYPLRIDSVVMQKIKVIAKNNGRSANKEIEFCLKKAVNDYENLNGVITIDEE